MEIENEEKEKSHEIMKEINEEEASPVVVAMTAAEQIQQQHHQHINDYDDLPMSLISGNDMDLSLDHHDTKVKQRRYWSTEEEERFFQIWGRDNWRLTRHGKNTIFFAQWADELKEKYDIDVKLEEIQCKVNQTRAKFRQVKKQLETSKNVTTIWKKYHIVEKILKNQFRSKDDEPIPPKALENNRDLSPTELLNAGSTSPTPTSMTLVHDQNVNITHIGGGNSADLQSTKEDANLSNVSLTDSNLTIANYNNEIFNDEIDIKAEIEEDLRKEEELINEYNQHSNSNYNNYQSADYVQQQGQTPELMQQQQQQHQQYQQQYVNQLQDNHHPPPQPQPPLSSTSGISSAIVGASEQVQNYNHITTNTDPSTNPNIAGGIIPVASGVGNTNNALNNYNTNANIGMHPPRMINSTTGAAPTSTLIIGSTVTQRRRGNQRYHMTMNNSNNSQQNGIITGMDNLESLYMEEVRRRNSILSEQSAIARKRLALEQRKINLMEEFFPKYMKLQEQILEKLERKTIDEVVAAAETASSAAATAITTTPEDSIDIQLNE